jgi:WD40 repeat protein
LKDLTVTFNSRSILDGQWSPNGEKFIIGTGCCKAYVGYYNTECVWWHTVEVVKCRSTVLCVKWHPSGRVVAVGSADFSVVLASAVIEDYLQIEDAGYKGPFDNITKNESIHSEIYLYYISII